jgi:hypothetical protein
MEYFVAGIFVVSRHEQASQCGKRGLCASVERSWGRICGVGRAGRICGLSAGYPMIVWILLPAYNEATFTGIRIEK